MRFGARITTYFFCVLALVSGDARAVNPYLEKSDVAFPYPAWNNDPPQDWIYSDYGANKMLWGFLPPTYGNYSAGQHTTMMNNYVNGLQNHQSINVDFAARIEWDVVGILVRGQPAVAGGAHKTLKTSLGVDLSVSLGTATAFLGEFPVPQQRKVLILSGESGEGVLQETARRVAGARGVDLANASIMWGFELPQLGRAEDVRRLEQAIREHAIEVVLLDPAYLCVLAGDTQGRQAGNVFDMGSQLLPLTWV